MVFAVCHDSKLSMKPSSWTSQTSRAGTRAAGLSSLWCSSVLRYHEFLQLRVLCLHTYTRAFHGSANVPWREREALGDYVPRCYAKSAATAAAGGSSTSHGSYGNLWNGSVNDTKLKEVFSFLITLYLRALRANLLDISGCH